MHLIAVFFGLWLPRRGQNVNNIVPAYDALNQLGIAPSRADTMGQLLFIKLKSQATSLMLV